MEANSKYRVLVVDDDPVCRRALEILVKGLGYLTTLASNGNEALEMAAKSPPDVVLLDVMMPGLNGFEVCERIRASALLRELPVILVTALMDHNSRINGLDAGADEFISKPYDSAELRARLKNLVRLNRYRRLLATRVQLSWVLGKAAEGYAMLGDDDSVHYLNASARRLLALPATDEQPISETFTQLVQRNYGLEPAPAWVGWPQALDPSTLQQARYLVPQPSAGRVGKLLVEMIHYPGGSKASRLVRLQELTAQVAVQAQAA